VNRRLTAAAALVLLTASGCYSGTAEPGPTVTVTPPPVTVTAVPPAPSTTPSPVSSNTVVMGSTITTPVYTTTVVSYAPSENGSDQMVYVKTCVTGEQENANVFLWKSWTLVSNDGSTYSADPESVDATIPTMYPNDVETYLTPGHCREGSIRFPVNDGSKALAVHLVDEKTDAAWTI
jgi:hypothetical protein